MSCGISFEASAETSYILTASGGMPPPPRPCPAFVTPVEDVFYPDEEPAESAATPPPALLSTSAPGWALLGPPPGWAPPGAAPINATPGDWAFGFQLLAVLPPPPGAPAASLAVLEATFARWGFLVALADGGGGEVARLRKGVGRAAGLDMPRYSYLADAPCGYYSNVYNNFTDLIAGELLAEGAGEATYGNAIKYLPPQRDYASIGGIWPYNKFSVSPDGRLKTADDAIYTPTNGVNDTGPGVLVWDPATQIGALGGAWPATNWTFTKSALVGSWLRVVGTVGYDYGSGFGFEQLAFAPASEPAASAYVRLRASEEAEWGPFAYFNVSSKAPPAPLDPGAFYAALLAEQALWGALLAPAASYALPGREGARQVDTAYGSLVASMSLYVGLQPNCAFKTRCCGAVFALPTP